VLVLSGTGALALAIAIISAGAAFVMNATWAVEHDCGNRYCRHVRRDDTWRNS
jgi:hypothetical protein